MTMPSVRATVASVALAILGHKMAILANFFEIWLSNLFFPACGSILVGKPIYNWIASIWPKIIFGILAKNNFWRPNSKLCNISVKFRFLAILKISCKNIGKWRRSRKKCKNDFRKIANWVIGNFVEFWRFYGTNSGVTTAPATPAMQGGGILPNLQFF